LKTTTGTAGPGRRIGGTAVVIGASMAGLCAARVLSERFDDLVAVDRDILPSGTDPRARVPQGHPHLLLNAGARLLEGWFPGIVMELEARGGVDFDCAATSTGTSAAVSPHARRRCCTARRCPGRCSKAWSGAG
jgi:hypothetical protein